MNNKKYLSAIGIEKKIKTFSDVEFLMKSHMSLLPFSSVSVLLNKELSLESSEIFKRLIDEKAGGYCFEHNKVMYEILTSYGFEVKSLLGRVLNNKTNISVPKTHRLNLLTYEGEQYLLDVGFGYLSPSKPIKFGVNPTKVTLKTSYVIKEMDNGVYELQMITDNIPYTLYSFELQNYNEMDFELGHFYSHKHPKAVFVNNLVLSLIKDDEILSLRNNTFLKRYEDKQEEVTIDSMETFKNILESDFKYFLNEVDTLFLYNNFVHKFNS